jgi:glutaminase
MAIKSLVVQVKVDIAGKAHNCQANANHRIEKGDVRLKVQHDRSWDHYCHACAVSIITRDIAKLTVLQSLTPIAGGED